MTQLELRSGRYRVYAKKQVLIKHLIRHNHIADKQVLIKHLIRYNHIADIIKNIT